MNTRWRDSRPAQALVATGLGLALLAACSSATSGEDQAAPCTQVAGVPDVLGCGTWTSTSGTSGGDAVGWLRSEPMQLSFYDGPGPAMGMTTPCNTLSGKVTFSEDSISSEQGIVAMSALCDDEAMSAEQWALDLFAEPMTYTVRDDELTLTSPDKSVTLTRTS